MPNFHSYISNGKYSVGCTGRVYLYDKDGAELAKFSDLSHAYTAAFSPKGDIFVVKTTEGRLGIYSADERRLIKKFRFSEIDGSQDDPFCFSPDGEWFYNIERHGKSYNSVLSVYRAEDFSLDRRLFTDESVFIDCIEYDDTAKSYYILGFDRGEDGNAYFVGMLCGDEILFKEPITEREYDFYRGYKELEFNGILDDGNEWSGLCYAGSDWISPKIKRHSLSKLWKYYREKRSDAAQE